MMSNNQKINENPFGTSDDYKTSPAGDLGKEYQRKVLALQLCLAHENFSNYKIATEVKSADLFDDLVLEYREKENQQKIFFVQIKNKKKKDLTAHMLMNNDDFDLGEYFLAYLKVISDKEFESFDKKLCSIYTNMKVTLNNESFVDLKEGSEVIKIYFDEVKRNENLMTHRSGQPLKIKLDEKNKKFFDYFKAKVKCEKAIEELEKKQKIIDEKLKQNSNEKLAKELSSGERLIKKLKEKQKRLKNYVTDDKELDEKIRNFFENFVLSTSQPEFDVIDKEIDEFCLKLFNDQSLKPELEGLFRPVKEKAQKVTKKFFDEFLRVKLIEREFEGFVGITKELLDKASFIEFEPEFVQKFKSNDRVSILRTPKDLQVLGFKLMSQFYTFEEIQNGKIIIAKLSTVLNSMENFSNCMEQKRPEIILILIDVVSYYPLPQFNEFKIVSVCDFNFPFFDFPVQNLSDGKLFQKLTKSSQEKLHQSEVKFQAEEKIKLSEILTNFASFKESVDDETLAKILNEKLTVGGSIKDSNFYEEFYIERIYKTKANDEISSKTFLQNFLDNQSCMPILIHEIAGMGKSTETIKIGMKIKENRKDFWVLKIELGSEKFSSAFSKWSKKNLIDLFESFVNNKFEVEIFQNLYKKGKVAILLDGFDEIKSSDFAKVLNKLFAKILLTNEFKNIFILTSRTNLIEDLINNKTKFYQEENLKKSKRIELMQKYNGKIEIYHLKPFDIDQQVNFMYEWILKNLSEDFSGKILEDELLSFCNNLIIKWSEPIKNGSNFLGIPLQIRMLAEIFTYRINESLKIFRKLPEISAKLNHTGTELFRIFIDTKLLVLLRDKRENAQELFLNVFNGELNANDVLLNLVCDSLTNARYTPILSLEEDKGFWTLPHRYEISSEVQKMMINVGLISSFTNDVAKFLHKAYPEFLVAEKFVKLIFDKTLNEKFLSENFHVNDKIFQVVLLQRNAHQMIPKFIEEFLKVKGMPPENARKVLCLYFNKMPHIKLDILDVLLKEGLTNFMMLIFESLQMESSLNVLDAMQEVISYAITVPDLQNSQNILKCFPIFLQKLFALIPKEKSEENIEKSFTVISRLMFTAFHNDPTHETLRLIKEWNVLKNESMKQKLVEKWLSFHYGKSSAIGNEHFLKFWYEIDSNLIFTLLKFNNEVLYVIFLDLYGFDGPLKFLENWAVEKEFNLEEITRNQMRSSKDRVSEFFKASILAPSVESIQNSKYLGPKDLLELLKENVEDFDDISFPFVVFWDLRTFNYFEGKLKKTEEIFANKFQIEYDEFFNMWLNKVAETCKVWSSCHLRNEFFPYPECNFKIQSYQLHPINSLHIMARSLIFFIQMEKISASSLNLDVCKFLHNYIFGLYQVQDDLIHFEKEILPKILANCRQKILNENFGKIKRVETTSNHNCIKCILCIKTSHKFCEKLKAKTEE